MSTRVRKHVGAYSVRRDTGLRRDVREAIDRICPDGIVEMPLDPDESYFFELHPKLLSEQHVAAAGHKYRSHELLLRGIGLDRLIHSGVDILCQACARQKKRSDETCSHIPSLSPRLTAVYRLPTPRASRPGRQVPYSPDPRFQVVERAIVGGS